MPSASEVRPGRWALTRVLFDNGYYSAVWGTFKGVDEPVRHGCLGVRWNGSGSHPGYPNQGGNPVWYREPEFMTKAVILALQEELNRQPETAEQQDYLNNITVALGELGG